MCSFLTDEDEDVIWDEEKRYIFFKNGVPADPEEALREVDADIFNFIGYHIIHNFEDGIKPKVSPFEVWYKWWKSTPHEFVRRED